MEKTYDDKKIGQLTEICISGCLETKYNLRTWFIMIKRFIILCDILNMKILLQQQYNLLQV